MEGCTGELNLIIMFMRCNKILYIIIDDVINITQAIYLWDDEKHNYDYETNTCEKGKLCGHYIQVYSLLMELKVSICIKKYITIANYRYV
jgi:hypothetical protein